MDTASPEPISPPRKRARYSKPQPPLETLKAQHANGKTTRELGQQYGVAHTTIQRWLDQHASQQQGVQAYRTQRADVFARIQAKSLSLQESLIDELEDDRLAGVLTPSQKASFLQSLNVISGTLYDKERLETGQSTQNVSVISKMIDSAVQDIYKPLINKGTVPSAPQSGATGVESPAEAEAPVAIQDSEAGETGGQGGL